MHRSSMLAEAFRPTSLKAVSVYVALALGTLSGCNMEGGNTQLNPVQSIDPIVTRVSMRDGIELYTEILLPELANDYEVPTLLLRTPYDLPTPPIGGLAPEADDTGEDDPADTRAAWQAVLDRGYAVVLQNVRGTQTSGGRNELFASEREDGVDTLEWIRAQPWSNGRVGAMGDSAAGFSVHLLAAQQPEGLDATFSQVSCGDIWGSAILPEHGGLKLETFLAFMLGQSLEVGDEHLASLGLSDDAIAASQAEVQATLGAVFGEDPAGRFSALTAQPFIDYPGVSTLLPQWVEVLNEGGRGDLVSYFDTRAASTVPGMHVTLWQDLFVECAIEDFQSLANGRTEQRLLILDGSHYDIDDTDSWPYLPMLDWFDRHLKGVTSDTLPPVQYAIQSASSIETPSLELMDDDIWPPSSTVDRTFYLDESGTLNEQPPSTEQLSLLNLDPMEPQTTVGGRNLVIEAGVAEQPPNPNTDSVLSYSTQPFAADTTIAGNVRLETTIRANLLNADLHARLLEVTADGRRVLVVAGMQRARFRDGSLAPMNLVPGQSVPLSVSLGNIAHRLSDGSRLLLELTGSNFPAWDLNPQVGGSEFIATERRAGRVAVQSSPAQPSRLLVPFQP